MALGTVTKYLSDRGFGFIAPAGGGNDIFFHVKAFKAGPGQEPHENDRVEYDMTTDPRNGRSRADNVRLV